MRFDDVTVTVIGDAMLDHYIMGKAERISPEAPVPVVNRQSSWLVPGGAANVARGLARLGCKSRLVCFADNDQTGLSLRQKVAAEGIEAIFVPGRNRPTISKTRIMAGGQQLLRLDEETIAPPLLPEKVALSHALEKLLEKSNALILSDYGKGVLLPDASGNSLCQFAISLAQKAGIPVLVDPKGSDWSKYAGASCVTPNVPEFQQICAAALGSKAKDSGAWERLAAQLCEKFSLQRILLTRGADGMILYEKGQAPLKIPTTAREVADVSGAGDTVIATLAACIATGGAWGDSAAIANKAAGIAVGKIGTAPVEIYELNNALLKNDEKSCVFSEKALLETIAKWRRDGNRIVFTNGCFDLLHPGHVALLRESASLGDKLVVALNSDASVARLKGSDRPIQSEQNRARVLSALADVTAVVIFEEDTPERLIHAIRPDVLVKGGDYKIENVVGADFVKSYGGKTHLVKLVEGQSTSALVEQMRHEESHAAK